VCVPFLSSKIVQRKIKPNKKKPNAEPKTDHKQATTRPQTAPTHTVVHAHQNVVRQLASSVDNEKRTNKSHQDDGDYVLSADDVVPMLAYVILKNFEVAGKQAFHKYANLEYLKLFLPSLQGTASQLEVHVANLEGALHFLESASVVDGALVHVKQGKQRTQRLSSDDWDGKMPSFDVADSSAGSGSSSTKRTTNGFGSPLSRDSRRATNARKSNISVGGMSDTRSTRDDQNPGNRNTRGISDSSSGSEYEPDLDRLEAKLESAFSRIAGPSASSALPLSSTSSGAAPVSSAVAAHPLASKRRTNLSASSSSVGLAQQRRSLQLGTSSSSARKLSAKELLLSGNTVTRERQQQLEAAKKRSQSLKVSNLSLSSRQTAVKRATKLPPRVIDPTRAAVEDDQDKGDFLSQLMSAGDVSGSFF